MGILLAVTFYLRVITEVWSLSLIRPNRSYQFPERSNLSSNLMKIVFAELWMKRSSTVLIGVNKILTLLICEKSMFLRNIKFLNKLLIERKTAIIFYLKYICGFEKKAVKRHFVKAKKVHFSAFNKKLFSVF